VVDETERFFASEFYANTWYQINERMHRSAVAIVRDELPNVSTEGGVVTVDLIPVLTPIVDRVLGRLTEFAEAIPDALLDRVDIDETVGVFRTDCRR
jgi:hypothetical protein